MRKQSATPPIKPPATVLPKNARLPDVETVTLANGLPVHLICTEGQDVARISLVWNAGSSAQSKPFAASATLNLLSEGSARLTAHEIAERLDFVGSYFDVSIDRDYAVATFCCLGKFFEPTLEMLSEIVLGPIFPEDEVDIYRRKRMERLAVERAKPATKARELFSAALFGDGHPYGISSHENEYLKLQRADILAFYESAYCAENCFAVASLGTDGAQKTALLELLGLMPQRSGQKIGGGKMSAPETSAKRVLELPDAVQSAIRIGRILFPRQHPDFVGMQVLATVLGGYFGSRLTQNLREERGYTYGVMAAMVNLREAGYLAIATEVGAEVADDAIEQIFSEMERLREEPVTEDELDTVRRSMLGEVMRIMDGPFGIVDVVIENIQIGGGANYLDDFIRQVEAITPERIRQLARKYLGRESFTTVVVG